MRFHRSIKGNTHRQLHTSAGTFCLLLSGAVLGSGCGSDGSSNGDFPFSSAQREVIESGKTCEFGGYRLLLSGSGDGSADLIICNEAEELETDVDASSDVSTQVEEAGDNCESGGVALLVDGEVVEYLCNGVAGQDGEAGADGVEAVAEGPGENCAAGGYALRVDGENVGYVCTGQDGDPATDDHILVEQATVAAGKDSDCPYGGVTLRWGKDAEEFDGVLEESELGGEVLACDPMPTYCQTDMLVLSDEDVARVAACGATFYGNLTLRGSSVTDLAPLLVLEEIHGDLRVEDIAPPDLTGLDNLRTVSGDLCLGRAASFAESYLTYQGTATGLGALEEVGGSLILLDESMIPDFQAFSSLRKLGALWAGYSTGLTSFKGLERLTSITIDRFPHRIRSFEGLENVTEILGTDGLIIPSYGDNALQVPSLAPLQNLTYASELSLESALPIPAGELHYLEKLEAVGHLTISGYKAGLDLTGVPSLAVIEGDLVVNYPVAGLDDLLRDVTRIGGDLNLGSQVGDASFLSQVTSIGGGMQISGLSDFYDFAALQVIGDNLPPVLLEPTIYLPYGFQKCGLVSLMEVHGTVMYWDGQDWPAVDAATYFDTLPMADCAM